jgi:ATP-dependent Clp protease adapter protein ClpS
LQFLGRRKSKLRIHRPESAEPVPSKNQAEADRILDKIHRQGQDSLTVKEREFLENYSRQLRKTRSRSS